MNMDYNIVGCPVRGSTAAMRPMTGDGHRTAMEVRADPYYNM